MDAKASSLNKDKLDAYFKGLTAFSKEFKFNDVDSVNSSAKTMKADADKLDTGFF
ncbi:hypothetical protein [Bifidobacterium aquikefiricola]|uniref:Uncharacterized protein n=1 Tax=Bifidobacterium aquikefiricola TaxID=3059038 RepID=A0AB39U6B9_9BIFI